MIEQVRSYSVNRVVAKIALLFVCFDRCGSSEQAAIVAIDREPAMTDS